MIAAFREIGREFGATMVTSPEKKCGREPPVTTRRLLCRMSIGLWLGLCFILFLSGCNRGLSPVQSPTTVQTGFGGTIRFTSAWPAADSVLNLRVVAFRNYPPQNILNEVAAGRAEVYPSISNSNGLPKFVDSLSYSFTLNSPATFRYVVVAMQYGSNIQQDWTVVGAYGYSHGAGQPDSVVVPAGKFINGIDIDVDFKNTPPNPLGSVAAPATGN